MRVVGRVSFLEDRWLGPPLQIGLFIYRLGVLVFLVALRDGGACTVYLYIPASVPDMLCVAIGLS